MAEVKKADKDLLNAIQSGTILKHAETMEKNSLPDNDGKNFVPSTFYQMTKFELVQIENICRRQI